MVQYDPQWDFDRRTITFLIPKFCLPAHQSSCQMQYSYNYAKHVGRTDGEAVERGWAAVNGFSGSTKEMGPGSRHDILDDAFGNHNWRKVIQLRELLQRLMRICAEIALAKTLLDRVKTAVVECSDQVSQYLEICSNTDEACITEWTRLVEAWEQGADFNPFEVHCHHM